MQNISPYNMGNIGTNGTLSNISLSINSTANISSSCTILIRSGSMYSYSKNILISYSGSYVNLIFTDTPNINVYSTDTLYLQLNSTGMLYVTGVVINLTVK